LIHKSGVVVRVEGVLLAGVGPGEHFDPVLPEPAQLKAAKVPCVTG
jgi:hypothetical protein